ncbi:MAG: YggS family pyridoxal phosphate-dependent enzyme [Actinomycetaceae bacterium]|nr:YggS family pyridoxal phosphate-dependent enzyme [Arcanobacterium sp.]MDD7504957.1 YggS family pyridoxal phosphate-dependent enzyme [Actinomycetaceae bacterium]MDY6143708.1 YggS family pyridoxal phosphate-dependent enzyme [Arcanobacterium sp.]
MVDIAANIAQVRERIERALERSGREPGSTKLMLAVKYQPIENLLAALDADERLFGHNLIPQLESTERELAAIGARGSDTRHTATVIGHVQSNKLSTAMAYAERIDTVDSLKTAERINRRQDERIARGEATGPYPILLQINSSGAPTQFGCPPEQLLELARAASQLEHIEIQGVMTIGAHTPDSADIIRSFELTRSLSQEMRELPGLASATEISMGMTHDLDVAVEHGSTVIRIGTAIFGPRPPQ